MSRHKSFLLSALILYLAMMTLYPANVLAQGIPEVIQKLNRIQQALDGQVIPKLDQCNECHECPQCPPCPAIGVPKTGQTLCYNTLGVIIDCPGTGQDGEFQEGMALPTPRFTDNLNGTITDNLTGLIWLKNAGCLGQATWAGALVAPNALADGTCGLSDGSKAGDWRLPNIRELHSLVNYEFHNPAISNFSGWSNGTSNDPFSNLWHTNATMYWSSTTNRAYPNSAWIVNFFYGYAGLEDKTHSDNNFVLAVRSGN